MQVSEIIYKLSNNVNDNVAKPINIKHKTPQTKTIVEVRVIADKLSQELNSTDNIEFYYKVAWHLPENIIWSNLEAAVKGNSPQKLFTWLCNQSLKKETV